ncbi:MAG TPA: hypothetical protein VFS40_00815 [Gemmatimonadales bacterium]|nr:hypothetical protein [Gemmatimonadales bacterium]
MGRRHAVTAVTAAPAALVACALALGVPSARAQQVQVPRGTDPADSAALATRLSRYYAAYWSSRVAAEEGRGPPVLELFRGRAGIGESSARGLALRGRTALPPLPPPPLPPPPPPPVVAPAGRAAARVFLECDSPACDYDYLRTTLDFVNHVRDRQSAQVLVLVTTQETAAGGTAFTLDFIGQQEFRGVDDSLQYMARPAASRERIREELAEVLKRGLVRYVNHTTLGERLRISYAPPAGPQATPAGAVRDPWNAWTFGTTLNGSVNGEESFRFVSLNASLAANRTTPAWKINASVQGRYSQSRVDVSDTATVTTVSRDYAFDALVVKGLGDHWSIGVEGTLSASTFLNQSLALRLAPAVEYNVFPYSQSTRRQFTIQYSTGATAYDYAEETIFGKTAETLLDQRLVASLSLRQPWGSVATSLEGSYYLQDPSKRHGLLVSNLDLHLFGGFSLLLMGGVELVRDQLYLAREGVTEAEILLQQRQLATSFRYWSSIGFGFTFGSPFANTVNPRFGGSSGGMPIIR